MIESCVNSSVAVKYLSNWCRKKTQQFVDTLFILQLFAIPAKIVAH